MIDANCARGQTRTKMFAASNAVLHECPRYSRTSGLGKIGTDPSSRRAPYLQIAGLVDDRLSPLMLRSVNSSRLAIGEEHRDGDSGRLTFECPTVRRREVHDAIVQSVIAMLPELESRRRQSVATLIAFRRGTSRPMISRRRAHARALPGFVAGSRSRCSAHSRAHRVDCRAHESQSTRRTRSTTSS